MSQEESTEKFLVVEPLKEVVIETDDAKNVIEFFEHFNLSVPQYLTDAVSAFEKDQTPVTQNQFRVALCKALTEGTESLYSDDIFKLIRQNTSQIVFYNEFNEQLEEALSEG
jgi:hypothetical protein